MSYDVLGAANGLNVWLPKGEAERKEDKNKPVQLVMKNKIK